MLPPSHISYTLATFDLLKERIVPFQRLDYRLAMLAALGPDLIDKPLAALYFYRRYKSAVLFAHTLVIHGLLLFLVIWKKHPWWPYALAFNGHAVLDRLWFFPNTWFWPFRGWHFHVWRKVGSEHQDLKLAYWYAFTRRPELWGWELGGILAGLWLIWRYQWYRWERLKNFLCTGRLQ